MSGIVKIEINFPTEVNFPDGFEQALDGLISMICEKYQRENPKRTMWASGFGGLPLWNEPSEPDFDMSVYSIQVSERQDLSGSNPHNPNREELIKALRTRRQKRRDETE